MTNHKDASKLKDAVELKDQVKELLIIARIFELHTGT